MGCSATNKTMTLKKRKLTVHMGSLWLLRLAGSAFTLLLIHASCLFSSTSNALGSFVLSQAMKASDLNDES